ncbi:MAG: tetratricopeptide repeat protein [Gemmatimonadota bacterium]|nr:MAG: tetratricopeptide repeat protein [Gemmatimonadota bacterium]
MKLADTMAWRPGSLQAALYATLAAAVLAMACADRAPRTDEAAEVPNEAALIARYAAPLEGAPGSVPLFDRLGTYHRAISTGSARAQSYFDQGLRLQYAFNHAEAIRAYEEALRYDPHCPICWWGIALASGNNINAPLETESGRRAYAAVQRAVELSENAGPAERDLIAALAARYGPDPGKNRVSLDSAYARAMADVAAAHPDDGDVLTLYAASLMNLSPWDYWDEDHQPRPGTEQILAALTRALELDPDNPGACHYYIHSVEAAYPERAVECADRLAALMPGAGHIVHMPGHIYIRVGRYADAVRANEHAVHEDEQYIADQQPGGGLYPTAYYPHNYHFMWFAASMAGMSEKALYAARTVAPKVPHEVAKQIYWIQNVLVLPQLAQVTFGRWEPVLEAPMPPEDLRTATAMARYARGVALAATGRPADAAAELDEIEQLLADSGEGEDGLGTNEVIAIARLALAGEMALRTGDPAMAVEHFTAAVEIEDSMLYEEPPLWYYPLRHSLGLALLEAGRPADAAAAYREDLKRFPENGWSLYGLAQALSAQGAEAEADSVRARFETAWSGADTQLAASRF